jgi:hypothetical protein
VFFIRICTGHDLIPTECLKAYPKRAKAALS